MNNNLEQFVRNNRNDFDDHESPPALWESIEEKLHKGVTKKRMPIWGILWKAAAIIIIFMSAWFLNDYFETRPTQKQLALPTDQATDNPVLNELSDAEAYYASQIRTRQEELVKYTREHPEIMEELKKEFSELDRNGLELKKDLAESNADEKVIEAIMQSYKVKLEILEQLLNELRESRGEQPKPSIDL